jgi:outer membrane protein OmpA-like peptidoglycan-associated protein
MNRENAEINDKAYELYKDHGSKEGHANGDWYEAERRMSEDAHAKRHSRITSMLAAIIGLLCAIVVILLFSVYRQYTTSALMNHRLTGSRVVGMVLDPMTDEHVVVFGDTHFGFAESTLSPEAKSLLNEDVSILKENPETNVRMAGYTSAVGSEETNQVLSVKRANAVRDYLIEEGIAPERITVIGYGRTRPALFEITPSDVDSKEAMANMRVLFEVVVK